MTTVAPLEEPGVAEMIRTISAQVSALSASTARIESALAQYVTQEQRAADQLLVSEREDRQNEKIMTLQNRATYLSRTVWTTLLGPVIVGLMVWLITKDGTV